MPKKKKKTRKYRINVKRLLITLICLVFFICGAVGRLGADGDHETPAIDADNIYSMAWRKFCLYMTMRHEVPKTFFAQRRRP